MKIFNPPLPLWQRGAVGFETYFLGNGVGNQNVFKMRSVSKDRSQFSFVSSSLAVLAEGRPIARATNSTRSLIRMEEPMDMISFCSPW